MACFIWSLNTGLLKSFNKSYPLIGEVVMSESTASIPIYEVTTLQQTVPITRSRSKINDDITSNSSEVSELSSDLTKTDSITEVREGKRKRKRKSSPSCTEEPQLKKQDVSPGEGRKLRSVLGNSCIMQARTFEPRCEKTGCRPGLTQTRCIATEDG